MLTKFVERLRLKVRRSSPSDLLRDLSHELRSDAVPAVLRDAAHHIASLLDGSGGGGGQGQEQSGGGVVINVTIAVAVGAPGKEQGAGEQSGQAPPNDAVVIASAVASFPSTTSPTPSPAATSKPDAGQSSNLP
jgi:hypothetical protein